MTPHPRSATLSLTVEHPEWVANAIKPDNTTEMETTVTDDTVTVTITRDSTRGLQSTLDDTIVNLDVATTTVQLTDQYTHDQSNT